MRSALCAVLLACSAACAGPPGDVRAPTPASEARASAETSSRASPPRETSVASAPLVAAASSNAKAPAPELVPIGSLPEVDAAMAAAIANHQLPGAVVAIGHRDGLVFLHAYGDRALVPAREPMTLDTIFDLASLTKPVVTATLIMKLVERGKIELDAHASKYLPELLAHGHRDVTVRQLLVHSAGFGPENPLRDYDAGPAAGLAAVLASPQLTAAGSEFRYSDLGFIVLGALIERVTGEPLDVLAEREIFAPLAMHDTRFRPGAELLARIAPTEIPDAVRKRIDPAGASEPVIRGKVHDPRAFRLGGVAGNAGAFTTATDLARFARMLLGGGELDGARVLSASSVTSATAPNFIGTSTTVRALGWDMRSDYSGLRGSRWSHRAFGHGGYTGTSLWIDPDRDLFVVVLSNRVHPNGKGYTIKLAGEIANVAAAHFARSPQPPGCALLAGKVETGLDVLRAAGFAALSGKRVALLANDGSRARDGTRTVELFKNAPELKLVALFAAEHGLERAREGQIADRSGNAHELPVYSLFGKTRRPTPEMLRGVDTLVFDLQDAGVRYFTYMSTLRQLLLAAKAADLQVLVLDRPNPLGAALAEGALRDADKESFVNYHVLPLRHGMTAGELARMMNDELAIHAKLDVITMRGYARELAFESTGLAWSAPSPNLPTLEAVELYPALALIEGANVSVGRGTGHPFALVGAPWVDGAALLAKLQETPSPGVELVVTDFTPTRDQLAGQLCHGLAIRVSDHRAFSATRFGFALAAALIASQREFRAPDMAKLVANQRTMDALLAGASADDLERLWEPDLMRFEARRQRYALYPSCDATAR